MTTNAAEKTFEVEFQQCARDSGGSRLYQGCEDQVVIRLQVEDFVLPGINAHSDCKYCKA